MASVSFRFNDQVDVTCEESAMIKDICLEVAPKLQLNPNAKLERESWILSSEDGENYIQNPFANSSPISNFRTADTVINVVLEITPLCMHGSPSVPKKGFLCGWC